MNPATITGSARLEARSTVWWILTATYCAVGTPEATLGACEVSEAASELGIQAEMSDHSLGDMGRGTPIPQIWGTVSGELMN